MFYVSKDDKIWLILWWSKSKCFDFFQIFEHVRAVGIFINLHTESVDSSIDLCVEEAVGQRDLVPKAVFSLYLLKHSLDGVHTPMNPVFSELQSVCLELCLNLFQQAQILIGMNSSIYHLTEGSYLCLFYWVFRQEWALRVYFLEIFADGHGFDDDLTCGQQQRWDSLYERSITKFGLTFLYSSSFCFPFLRSIERVSNSICL